MRTITISSAIVALIALGYTLSIHLGVIEVHKVRYIRSQDLIYEYDGMKEAQAKFGRLDADRRAKVDTLRKDVQEGYQTYQRELSQLSTDDKASWENRLAAQQSNLVKFAGMVEQESKAEEEELLGAVLQQVNDFIQEYAEEQGYAMVYGTSAQGNILYGDPELDITDDVLKALNKHYRGE